MTRFVAYGLAACALAALPATSGWAQRPGKPSRTLLGRWQAHHVGFKLPPARLDLARQRIDVHGIRDLNEAVQLSEAHLTVEFRADSTYPFTATRGGRSFRTETGTFALRRGRLLANAPSCPDGSSFHDQQLLRLARRTLVLVFPVGPDLPGVSEEITCYRVGAIPGNEPD